MKAGSQQNCCALEFALLQVTREVRDEMIGGGALVTGGAVRIGAAIVERLAKAGFSVAIHCNASTDEAEALARRLSEESRAKLSVISHDLSSAKAKDVIGHATDALRTSLHLLVNSASVFEGDSADDFDDACFERHMAINARAPLALAREFARQAPDGSSIVNLLDQRVLRSNPRYFSYTLSKCALHAATRIMAQTFAPSVRVNGVAPGLTLANDTQNKSEFERRIGTLPLRRGGSDREVAEVVYFLSSCPSVTGQTIAVDGGQHLAWQTPDALPLA